MAKKTEIADIRKFVGTKSLIVGSDRTIKELKKGNLDVVFIASNCAGDTKETIKYYCGISKISFEELKEDDAEIGIICKKQFSISVAGVLKSK